MESPCSKKNGLADPSRLLIDEDDKQLLRVVIETPKGSRNKFAFDPELHVFELKKVLPAGTTFPYDFGSYPPPWRRTAIPSTYSCSWMSRVSWLRRLSCCPVGAIEGEQKDKKGKERNDRIIAVEKDAHSFADVKTIDHMTGQAVRKGRKNSL